MNSAGGRCHDNARCESMWARMKSELLYGCYDAGKMSTDELLQVSVKSEMELLTFQRERGKVRFNKTQC